MSVRIENNPDWKKMAEALKKDLWLEGEKAGMDFIHKNFEEEAFFDDAIEPWPNRKNPGSYFLLRVTNTLSTA